MNQWCSQHRITETDFFRACRPSAFRTSGPSGLQQFFLWLSPVPGLESGVWLSLEWVASSQSWAERPLPPPGRRVTADRLLTTHKLVQKVYECDNVTTVTTRQQQRTNRTIFPCPCKNCSVTAVRHIGHASASFQCFSTTANTVSQFIRLSQRPQLEPVPKARKRKRAVRSVCDCIMCSFSVVCDRYTNTSVTVTVTVTESLL